MRIQKGSTQFYLLGVILLFVISQFVALFNTNLFILGLLGETQRRNGILFYLTMMVILLYAAMVINFDNIFQLLSRTLLIGLVLVSYGSLQILGKDFVKWNNPHNSMLGTLGNPNFASSLLALIFLIALFLLIYGSLHPIYKLISIIIIILGFNAIYQSNSRQGFFVISLGILLFAAILAIKKNKIIGVLVSAISLTIITLGIFGMLQKGPLAYLLYKDSVSVRGFYWKAAVNMFESAPLTGVGLDSYGSYFKEFRDPQYSLRYGYELTSSNAHNVFLQMFATGGFMVGATYCLLLALILFIGFKNVNKYDGNNQKVSIALLSIWIAFQAQSLISIDNIAISIWGWVLGGAIIGINQSQAKEELQNMNNFDKDINLSRIIISSLFLIPSIFVSVLLHRQEADLWVAKSAILQNPINQELARLNAQKVLDNPLADPFYKFESAQIFYELGRTTIGEQQIGKLLDSDPRNLLYLDWLLRIDIRDGEYSRALDRALQIENYDPWNAKNMLLIGELYKKLGRSIDMEKMRIKINTFAPNTEIAIQANQILI
jgi:O-antigen ligase